MSKLELKEKKSFEWYVKEGKKAILEIDKNRWYLGELASKVEKEYGKSNFEKWCTAIGLEINTGKRYRWVYRYWSKMFDVKLFQELRQQLQWSYFEIVLRFRKYGINPLEFLSEIVEKNYSTAKVKKLLLYLKKKYYTKRNFPITNLEGKEFQAFNFITFSFNLEDYKFLKELNDKLNLGFEESLKVTEWLIEGILQFVRINKEKLMDELLGFLKSKSEAKFPMSFRPELIPKILEGKKTMTTRNEKRYDKGDIVPFVSEGYDSRMEGRYLLITNVYEKKLGDYTDEDARKEGFDNLDKFKQYWKEELEKYYGKWNDNKVFWVYEFKLL
jgi:uncharacterized protein YhfF